MEIKELISSGKLELYVYGALPASESSEITQKLREYPEIKAEVEEIEAALIHLSAEAAPYDPKDLFQAIKNKLSEKEAIRQVPPKRFRIPAYMGWAASLLLLAGLFFLFDQNQDLKRSLETMTLRNAEFEAQIAAAREDAEKTQELLEVLRDRNIKKIPLQGQEIAPESYAAVYWNEEQQTTFIDAKELPAAPEGMVYQVWSLKLDPLAAVSIGLLDDLDKDADKIFRLENPNSSEGFGITLEPEGGSETPTLENLYTLGTVSI